MQDHAQNYQESRGDGEGTTQHVMLLIYPARTQLRLQRSNFRPLRRVLFDIAVPSQTSEKQEQHRTHNSGVSALRRERVTEADASCGQTRKKSPIIYALIFPDGKLSYIMSNARGPRFLMLRLVHIRYGRMLFLVRPTTSPAPVITRNLPASAD